MFAPVARHETIRLVIAITANRNCPLIHLDVKSTFLNGPLQEEVYVSQPSLFERKKSGRGGVQITQSFVWIKASAQSLEFED